MKTLKKEFGSYLMHVIPPDASDEQQWECRRAFYAGARSAASLLGQAADAGTEDAGVVLLEAFHQELRDFGDKVAKGKA